MRPLLAIIFLLYSTNSFAAEKSYSVTIKPSAGIFGTTSFNIHEDNSATLLVYESPAKITEAMVNLDTEESTEIVQLLEIVLDDLIKTIDYSSLPEYKQTSAVTVTQDKVTKSISTRRYTKKLIKLIYKVNQYIPKENQIKLEMK